MLRNASLTLLLGFLFSISTYLTQTASELPPSPENESMILLKETQIKAPLEKQSALNRTIFRMVCRRRMVGQEQYSFLFELQGQSFLGYEQPDHEISSNRVHLQLHDHSQPRHQTQLVNLHQGERSPGLLDLA